MASSSAQKKTNLTKPSGLFGQPETLRINSRRGFSIGEVRQLTSKCEVTLHLKRKVPGAPQRTQTAGGRTTDSEALSNEEGKRIEKRDRQRASGGKKKASSVKAAMASSSKRTNATRPAGLLEQPKSLQINASSTFTNGQVQQLYSKCEVKLTLRRKRPLTTVSSNRKRREVGPSMRTLACRKRTNASGISCTFCEKAFPSMSDLEEHLTTHTKEDPCHLCGRKLLNKRNMKDHARRHLGVKPHRCDVCQMAFVTRIEVKSHKATHSLERAFRCEVCGSGFRHLSSLSRHRHDSHQGK